MLKPARNMIPRDLLRESIWAVVLFIYIMCVLVLTKKLFKIMMNKNFKVNVAVYYNRKMIHVLAGGVVAFIVPYIFSSPLIPTIFAMLIGLILYLPHRKKNLLKWFQVSENAYEVNFCFAWGLSLMAVWLVTGNPYYAIVPPLFMALGDGITGVVRNSIYGTRTKSWIGNLAMLAVTIPIGIYYAHMPGLLAAIASTLVEHFEIPPFFDDNVLIAITSSLILVFLTCAY